MIKKVFVSFLLFCTTGLSAQINATYWGVEDTILNISKTTDFGTVHDYIELFNNAGQDLDMRWIAYFEPGWPSLWTASFQDPGAWHQNVQHLDSADFTITNPIGFQNKLIIGVSHFSMAGFGTIRLKVFPVNYPNDFLWLYYNTQIAQGNAYASSEALEVDADCIVNQLTDKSIQVVSEQKVEISIYNLSGKLMLSEASFETTVLDLQHFEAGMYVVHCELADGNVVTKKVVL